MGVNYLIESDRLNFNTIDYSQIDPKKLNGNRKIVKTYLLFIIVGSCLVVTAFLLNLLGILDDKADLKNILIQIICDIVCVIIYGNIYYKSIDWRFYDNIQLNTCLKLLLVYILYCAIFIPLCLHLPGVHLGIVSVWAGGALSLLGYNAVAYLRDLNKMKMTSKYDQIISQIKFWVNFIYIGMFVYGFGIMPAYKVAAMLS